MGNLVRTLESEHHRLVDELFTLTYVNALTPKARRDVKAVWDNKTTRDKIRVLRALIGCLKRRGIV